MKNLKIIADTRDIMPTTNDIFAKGSETHHAYCKWQTGLILTDSPSFTLSLPLDS